MTTEAFLLELNCSIDSLLVNNKFMYASSAIQLSEKQDKRKQFVFCNVQISEAKLNHARNISGDRG